MAEVTTIQRTDGSNADLYELIKKGDIEGALSLMNDNNENAELKALDYNVENHSVMGRVDKVVTKSETDQYGNYKEERECVSVSKLPIAYQEFINEMALVFLLGRPISWSDETIGDENETEKNAFAKFLNALKSKHFNSKIRECKRLAGMQTESAMFFNVFLNKKGNVDFKINVLAKTKGDNIYTRFDILDNMTAFAWGYETKSGDDTIRHIDFYTADFVFKCTNKDTWQIKAEQNKLGKIPVVYFSQKVEWDNVQPLIEKMESNLSKLSDTNDYFAQPILLLNAGDVTGMPSKDAENKTLQINAEGRDVNSIAKYLTWDNAPESKKYENEQIHKRIMQMSFTPDIDFESMRSLSNASGKALSQIMMLADIKARKHEEKYSEYATRCANLVLTIIALMDATYTSIVEEMTITPTFNRPFADDIADVITNLTKSVDGGILSKESAVELNPLTKDSAVEKERINSEEEARKAEESNILNGGIEFN